MDRTAEDKDAVNRDAANRDIVEALAERLYGSSNSTNVPWVRRDRTIQDRWRKAAKDQLASADQTAGNTE